MKTLVIIRQLAAWVATVCLICVFVHHEWLNCLAIPIWAAIFTLLGVELGVTVAALRAAFREVRDGR